MTNHGVGAFVDAILADRPPEQFSATPDDADLLRLQLADGTIVTAGNVVMRDGTGEWARSVRAQGDQMRRAVLVTSTGVTVVTATFS
jgi:hypothetical protein